MHLDADEFNWGLEGYGHLFQGEIADIRQTEMESPWMIAGCLNVI